jgi:4-amino-4-deoxychorismate lyase
MVNYLLKKSYQRKNFKEIEFDDLWNKDGVFTTMWIYNKPPKILFFKTHIDNLIKSLKAYKIYDKGIKSKILKLINENIDKTKPYNHLLRVALNKNTISISLRDRVKLNNKFGIKLVHYERVKPEYKNLKYKKILGYLSKMNTSKEDIALCVKDKIFETGTSNLLFVKNNKIYSPKNKYYRGTNFKFYEKKFNIIKKDIYLKELNQFDEILLVGSGKGVVSTSYIVDSNWKRRKRKIFNSIYETFEKEFKKEKYIYN